MIETTTEIIPRTAENQQVLTAINISIPRWRALLYERGISDQAIARAGIRPHGHNWLYRISPAVTARRLKAFPGQTGAKYHWKPNKPDNARFYDPAGDLADHIAAAGGVLILASGEADVWACWSAGVYNVTCTLHGEGTIPPWFVERLIALDVRAVQLWPDRDAAGLNHARKVYNALTAAGIAVEVYALPFELGSKGDLNTLLIETGPDGFQAALVSCPPAELPPAEQMKTVKPPRRLGQASRAESFDQWARDDFDPRVPSEYLRGARNQKGFHKNGPCPNPAHQDHKPSFGYNPESRTGYCFVCGPISTDELADLWGVPRYERRQNTPKTHSYYQSKSEQKPSAETTAPDWWPQNRPPRRLIERLLTMRRDPWLADTPDHGAAAAGYSAWGEAINAGILAPDQAVSLTDLVKAGQQVGRNVSRDTWKTGLEQLIGLELCGKINTYTETRSVCVKNSAKISRGAPSRWLYRLRPLHEAIPAMLGKLSYRLFEKAFEDIPVHFRPEFNSDLTADDHVRIAEYSAPLFDEYAEQRQQAAKIYAERLAIFEGRYSLSSLLKDKPFSLPADRETPNARAFRLAFYAADLDAEGGERERAYRAAYPLGVCRQTLAAYRDREEVVTIENWDEFPISAGDVLGQIARFDKIVLERDWGVTLIAEDGAQIGVHAEKSKDGDGWTSDIDYDDWAASHQRVFAKIRRANGEKRVELASPAERAAFEARREERRQKAQRRPATATPHHEKQTVIWENYSDPFIAAQALMRLPGYIDIREGIITNTRTGKTYANTPPNLWRALADDLRPPVLVSEEATMPTFTANSEPPEREKKLNIMLRDQRDRTPSRPLPSTPESWPGPRRPDAYWDGLSRVMEIMKCR